jgi:hypothetical protein
MESIINNLSVDCVIFGFDNQTLNVLLTKRELKDPASGELLISDYTLQGHHVLVGENVDDAAKRVLLDKTGLSNIYLEQFHTFGNTNRLQKPNDQLWKKLMYPMVSEHVVSVCYFSLVDSSKVKPDHQHEYTSWIPVSDLPELGYDHEEMIKMALEHLRNKIFREPIGFELLPDKFTLSELQALYEAILNTSIDRRNFWKKVSQMKYVIPLDEKRKTNARRSSQVFIFSRDVYDRTKKEKLSLSY